MTDTQGGRPLGWRQTLAAMGVVLSLGFVGLEIRQNTQAVRGSTLQAVSDAYANLMVSTFLDENLQALYPRIAEGLGPDSFAAAENGRLTAMYFIFLAHLENTYVQRNAGVVGDEVLESYGWQNALLRTNHFRESVEGGVLAAAVGPEFRQYFIERMEWQ